jgi:uncharacterized RDD family membrane protein YckC
MSETLQIDTPENVSFAYPVAGLGSRFMAAIIDSVFIVLLQLLVFFLLDLTVLLSPSDPFSSWLIAIYSLIGFAFFWGYYIFFELISNGQSPGKRWVGLRVIRTDGMPISLAESLIRNLVRTVDFLPAAYGVGVVTMFINSQSRRLGDLAAGTLVVYDRQGDPLPVMAQAPGLLSRSRGEQLAPSLDLPVEKLTNQDILLIQQFFSRRTDMIQSDDLAARILTAAYKRMGISDRPIESTGAGSVLAAILVEIQRRAAGGQDRQIP